MSDDDRIDSTEVDDEEIDEELGYADCDWDSVPEESVELHDRILDMEYEELDALDFDTIDDLGRWAAAQAFWDLGDEDRFHDLALRIVRSDRPHKAIDYAEICLELANDYFLDEKWDEAVFLLPDVERLVPEDPTIRARFGALISIGRGREEDGLGVFQELADANDRDAGTLLLLGQDLFGAGLDESGAALLDKAEEVASMANDRDMLALIAEFREDLAAEG